LTRLAPVAYRPGMDEVRDDLRAHGYRTIRVLGRNSQGGRVTLLCETVDGGERVVIKHFSFARQDADWDGYKAHEREIEALRSLDHPAIPSFIDAFGTPSGFCLVQEFKDAPSLEGRRSWRFEEIHRIATDLLRVLIYLQRRAPAVIHRDIKPDNLLRDADGRLYLIDFGLARSIDDGGASTISAGTPGFMAPEQFFMRPLGPATDLYGLGATLVALLSGLPASGISALVDTSFRFDLSPVAQAAPEWFLGWLARLLEPEASARFRDAEHALSALQDAQRAAKRPARPPAPRARAPQASAPRRPPAIDARDEGSDLDVSAVRGPGRAILKHLALWSGLVGISAILTLLVQSHQAEKVAARAPALAIEDGRLECPAGVTETLRSDAAGVPSALDRVVIRGGCVLTLDGLEVKQVLLYPGANLTLTGATVGEVAPIGGSAAPAHLVLDGGRIGTVRGGRFAVEAKGLVVERMNLGEGSHLSASDMLVGAVSLTNAGAVLEGGRVTGGLRQQGGTLRATDLELQGDLIATGRAVVALDRPVIGGVVRADTPAVVIAMRAPVLSHPPRLGAHGRVIGAEDALDDAVAELVRARDEGLAEAATAQARAKAIRALEGGGCAAITGCVGQDAAADGPGEATFTVSGGRLALEGALHGEVCLTERAGAVAVDPSLRGTLSCPYDVTVDGGARLITPGRSLFRPSD